MALLYCGGAETQPEKDGVDCRGHSDSIYMYCHDCMHNGLSEAFWSRRSFLGLFSGSTDSLSAFFQRAHVSDILFENDLPKNKGRDGIGAESILSASAKYNGVVDFSASDGIFFCQVVLSNKMME